MCQHRPVCKDRIEHIRKLKVDLHNAPDHPEYDGDLVKADYRFAIRFEEKMLAEENEKIIK